MAMPMAFPAPTPRRITAPIAARLTALGIDPSGSSAAIRSALATTLTGNVRPLLGSSTKVELGSGLGILSAVMYMSPATEAGYNLCPWATRGCAMGCLGHSAGNLRFSSHQKIRIAKSLLWRLYPATFLSLLRAEITLHESRAMALGKVPAIRLNGSTDIRWERSVPMDMWPETRFYDYTKAPALSRDTRPAGYHLTYSLSESPHSKARALEWLQAGGNVAVVVAAEGSNSRKAAKLAAKAVISRGWNGYPCVDGDTHDARWLDPAGHAVVLYAKGAALRDESGFVQRVQL